MFKKTLQVEFKNTLQDTPLVLNPVSSVLNKEETPSVQDKVLACNSPEVDLLQHHTGDQNSRVSDNVYVLNIRTLDVGTWQVSLPHKGGGFLAINQLKIDYSLSFLPLLKDVGLLKGF